MGAVAFDRFAGLSPGQAMDILDREEAERRAAEATSPEDMARARLSIARAEASFHVLKQAGAGKPWRVLWSTDDEAEAVHRYGRARPAFRANRMTYASVLLLRGNPASMVGREVLARTNVAAMPPMPGQPGIYRSPRTAGLATAALFLYVKDVDKAFARAVEAGCTIRTPFVDMFWGDRFGQVIDPFGHTWAMATHVEDVSLAEMQRRQQEFFTKMDQAGAQG